MKGCRRFSILSGGAFGMHASELRGQVRGIFFFLRFPRSIFTDWVGGKKGMLASFTLNGDSFGMHSKGVGSGERVGRSVSSLWPLNFP